jgi:type I restriction enzyme, S subunit
MKWENYQLKEIANYWTGKVEATSLDASNYVSTDNLIPDRGGIVKSNYVPTSGNANSYSENDVLISNIRPYFKKIWFADKEGGCSNDVLVFRAKENVEPQFLYYQLSKDAFFDDMVAGSNGTKMPRGNKTSIMEFKLKIPPLPTQRKIAGILSAYDDLIENNLKRIKLLEEKAFLRYKQIVMEEKMDEFFIEEICETLGGGTPATGDRRFWDEGEILWFSPTDLTKHHSIVLLDSAKKITELGLQKSSAKLVPPKTILMTSRASIGYFGLINKPASTNQGFINIIPFNEKHRAYMLFDLKNRKEEIIGNANGSTFLEISKSKFRQMKIKLPEDEKILIEFETEFETLFNLIENLLKQNTKLREARDILLPKLMNGQIEV